MCPGGTVGTEEGPTCGLRGGSCKKHPGRVAGSGAGMSWEVLEHSAQGVPEEPKRGGPGAFQGVLPLGHLGKLAGAVVSTDQGCHGMAGAGGD